MNIRGKKVSHKTLGNGTVTDQTDTMVTIAFNVGEKKFLYPSVFKEFVVLCDSALQELVLKEIEDTERLKAEEREKQRLIPYIPSVPKKKRIRSERPNIAFKCNYCDGGKSETSIGFDGLCSERIIRYNIDVEQRTWCCSEDSPCYNYLCGYLSREDLEKQLADGGFVCYESQMLRDWKAMAGVVQHGERKGQPMRLANVHPNSLCILTTRMPNSTEAERLIFAVFLIDETYDGDSTEEGFVTTQSEFKISLSQKEAEEMLFWRYHANDNKPEKEAWSSGLHRYLNDKQALQILRDIVEIKKNTRYEKLARDFLETFSRIVGIDIEDAGEPNGALINKFLK